MDDVQYEKLSLFPNQISHAERLISILKNHPYALDLSSLGSGKTYTSSYIATRPEFDFKHVIVVAPVSVQTKWKYMNQHHGIPVTYNLSYCGLRSVKCKQPSHGLLRRRDYNVEMKMRNSFQNIKVDKVEFLPTSKLQEMVNQGTLMVFDEIQNIKNISAQFAACQTMIKTVVESNIARSKVICLSGSPIDKHEQAVTLFRTLNVMQSDALAVHNVAYRRLEWRGIQEIINFCSALNPVETNIIERSGVMSWDQRRGAYNLFQNVFKPSMSSCMPTPRIQNSIDKRNAFYQIERHEDLELMKLGVKSLEKACSYNPLENTVNFAHTSGTGIMSQVTRALLQIETAKIDTFARVARRKLEENQNCKVVICANYSATIKDVMNLLEDYNPLLLNGSVAMSNRSTVLCKFQKPSSEHRVLIGNLSVCSTGIDLDDKHGDFPRFALVSPNYSSISTYQLSHRFCRLDTKSDSVVHMLYGRQIHELRVLNALARKGNIMKETTPEQAEAGVVFPGDYPKFEEIPDDLNEYSDMVVDMNENITSDEPQETVPMLARVSDWMAPNA